MTKEKANNIIRYLNKRKLEIILNNPNLSKYEAELLLYREIEQQTGVNQKTLTTALIEAITKGV